MQHAHATVFAEQFKTVKELPKFSFPFDKRTNGGIRHVCFDLFRLYWFLIIFQIAASVESQADGSIKPHFLVSAETGSVQLWSEGRVKWKREEALASIAAAEFVEFPEQQAAETLHAESKESFFGRLARHVVDAQVTSFFTFRNDFLTQSCRVFPNTPCTSLHDSRRVLMLHRPPAQVSAPPELRTTPLASVKSSSPRPIIPKSSELTRVQEKSSGAAFLASVGQKKWEALSFLQGSTLRRPSATAEDQRWSLLANDTLPMHVFFFPDFLSRLI